MASKTVNGDFALKPMPSQKLFIENPARFKIFAGGFGSAKTITGAMASVLISLWYPKNFGLVGRSTYPELRDTTRRELLQLPIIWDGKEYPLVESPLAKSFNKAEGHLVFINGSEIVFRSLDDAFHKIKSLNLGWFWIDETTEVAEEVWMGLEGRLRRKGVPHVGFGTTNPEGHDWVWKRFIASAERIERIPSGKKDVPEKIRAWGKNTFLMSSYSSDNVHLPKDYVPNLVARYPDEWVKRYVYGSFDTFSGLIYANYRDDEPFLYDPRNVTIEPGWNRFVALDWGYRNPTAIVWGAVDFDGNLYIYDEYYAGGKVVSEVAEIIKAKSGNANIRQYLIDPSTRNNNGNGGRSILEEFAECGLYFNLAKNEVRAGINRVQEYLKIGANGYPKLRVNRHCENWRREIQTYKWKDLKANATQDAPEKPVKKDDHLMDATKYLVAYLYDTPMKSTQRETTLDRVWKMARTQSLTAEYDWMAD